MSNFFQGLSQIAWVKRVLSHVPPTLFAKFLSIGVINTAFGYSSFAVLAYLFGQRFPAYGFVLAGVLSAFLNITFSFLSYKWFVFRTRGNYLVEWLKCFAVYGTSAAIGTMLLPIVVLLLRALTSMYTAAPYAGAAIIMVGTTLFNFFALRHFSFKTQAVDRENG